MPSTIKIILHDSSTQERDKIAKPLYNKLRCGTFQIERREKKKIRKQYVKPLAHLFTVWSHVVVTKSISFLHINCQICGYSIFQFQSVTIYISLHFLDSGTVLAAWTVVLSGHQTRGLIIFDCSHHMCLGSLACIHGCWTIATSHTLKIANNLSIESIALESSLKSF